MHAANKRELIKASQLKIQILKLYLYFYRINILQAIDLFELVEQIMKSNWEV
jgi:hypothetical protein